MARRREQVGPHLMSIHAHRTLLCAHPRHPSTPCAPMRPQNPAINIICHPRSPHTSAPFKSQVILSLCTLPLSRSFPSGGPAGDWTSPSVCRPARVMGGSLHSCGWTVRFRKLNCMGVDCGAVGALLSDQSWFHSASTYAAASIVCYLTTDMAMRQTGHKVACNYILFVAQVMGSQQKTTAQLLELIGEAKDQLQHEVESRCGPNFCSLSQWHVGQNFARHEL